MQFNHSSNMSLVSISESEGKWMISMMVRDNHPFVHIDFVDLKPSVYKELKAKITDLKYFLGCMGYPYLFGVHYKENTQLKRLAEKLGFKELTSTPDGGRVMVIETDLKEVNDNG